MQQSLHLLVVEPGQTSVEVTWVRGCWMLPVLVAPLDARVGPMVSSWLAARGTEGEIVGQWVGRATARLDAMDWLVVVRARAGFRAQADRAIPRFTLSSLLSAPSLVSFQGWALARVTRDGGLPMVPGPFGAFNWWEDVASWLRQVAGVSRAWTVAWHRVTAYEFVAGLRSESTSWFLKGLFGRRRSEAVHTQSLSALAPQSFARTLAIVRRPDASLLWLTDACPGQSLAETFTPAHVRHVVRACARLQRQLESPLSCGDGLQVPAPDLMALTSWTSDVLQAATVPHPVHTVEALQRACEVVEAADYACSIIPLDLHPTNVFIRGDEVRLIDLEDACRGPSPLAAVMFARRLEKLPAGAARPSFKQVCESYERAWRIPGTGPLRWAALDAVGEMLLAQRDWRKVKIASDRGEIHDVLASARLTIARRLSQAACRYLAG